MVTSAAPGLVGESPEDHFHVFRANCRLAVVPLLFRARNGPRWGALPLSATAVDNYLKGRPAECHATI